MATTVGLFVPCYVDELWPQAGRAAVELIEGLGLDVAIARAACCGQVLSNAGEDREGRRVRAVWERAHAGIDEVVVLSASCTGHLWKTGGATPTGRIREFCDWFADRGPARFPRPVDRRLALHGSCSALRETASAGAARDLLGRVPGLAVVEPRHADECCGFGGSFATAFAALSVEMGRDKVTNLVAAGQGGIDGVVSADCSCLLHLRGVAPADLAFFHVAEVLREAAG